MTRQEMTELFLADCEDRGLIITDLLCDHLQASRTDVARPVEPSV